jgi:tetratricopeptide (TPR) repeat protein
MTATGGQEPTPPARPRWIAGRWLDLLIGCGGWSLPLLAIAYAMSADAARTWSGAFYTLALICNYPHYMATVYRAYGRASDRAAHRLYTVWGTAVLVALGAVAHLNVALLPLLFTAYVMWSPWHYTGQNYGLLMMFLKRAGLEVTPDERRLLRVAFVASYVLLLAVFNEGASSDPLVRSLALPPEITRLVAGAALVVFLVGGVMGLARLGRRADWRAMTAPATLYLTQGLWFVAPTALAWTTGLAVPQTRYSSGILAVMHSAQYLWVTQYFAKREQGGAWAAHRYWIAVLAGGVALFLPVPWLASYGARIDFTTSMLIVTAIVNLHHFMIDGVVWKLRDTRVATALTASAPAPAVAAAPRAPAAHRAAWAAAIGALLVLAAVDQWRYRLASQESDPAALQAAIRINPYDNPAQVRLLQMLVEAGRQDDAREHLDRMIAAQPGHVEARVNAGVLARRTGRTADAERHWLAALNLDRSMAHVHLYLAELLDEANRAADAVPHYRAYLELVVQQRSSHPPDPRTVIPVIVKFAEALARTGEAQQAGTQFALAEQMARQIGLSDLEQLARQRLSQLP